jgi:MatE protein
MKLLPLAAQAVGARDPRQVRRAVPTGLWAALLVSIPIMVLPRSEPGRRFCFDWRTFSASRVQDE